MGGALVSLNTFMAPQEISKVGPPPPVMFLNVSSNKSDSSLSCIEPNVLCLKIVLCFWETVVMSVWWRLESGALNTVIHISVTAPRAKATLVELLQLSRERYPGSQKPKNAAESVILHNKPYSRDLWGDTQGWLPLLRQKQQGFLGEELSRVEIGGILSLRIAGIFGSRIGRKWAWTFHSTFHASDKCYWLLGVDSGAVVSS